MHTKKLVFFAIFVKKQLMTLVVNIYKIITYHICYWANTAIFYGFVAIAATRSCVNRGRSTSY